MSFIGSKGAFVSSLSTTERFHLEDSWNFWDDPCENWRVTCKGLSFGKYGAPLGQRCQQWRSSNHQWSNGACLDLGTGT